jgi:2,3-bisphosphoglycerate-dependent phosphoglycerate mutase
MSTFIYMVRHGESPKNGNERTRGLTDKGHFDAQKVTTILMDQGIDVVISSPYISSILTVENLAQRIGQEVIVVEDLKERVFSSENNRLSDLELIPLLEKSFIEPNYSLDGGESNAECQNRAIKVMEELLTSFRDKRIVIGTHGAVMTLMMGYFDKKFGLKFLHNTSKPDIYRMEFEGHQLVSIQRLWDSN